jgi:hypothetical protein
MKQPETHEEEPPATEESVTEPPKALPKKPETQLATEA